MKIGVTHTGSGEKHQNYVKWVVNNEDIQIITLSHERNNFNDISNCDALVLSGGVDIHPDLYGGSLDYPKKQSWKKERDLFEKSLLESALDSSIPILGICRGLQLINIVFKGTLIQDLGKSDDIHEGNPDKIHLVNFEQNTVLYDIVSVSQSEINSAHHQAIDKLGEGFLINSRAVDGTIEGVEWLDKTARPFLLGVQWHPERMFKLGMENFPASKAIRERFVEEVKTSIENKK